MGNSSIARGTISIQVFDYLTTSSGIRHILLPLSGADPGFDQGGGAPDRDRPKTAILGPQFCRILVLGPHFWWSGGGARAPGAPPLDPPLPLPPRSAAVHNVLILK